MNSVPSRHQANWLEPEQIAIRGYGYITGCIKKMVIELWSALARSLYNLQKSFFHSRKDQAFSFRMSPFL